eukprot:m.235640 g.235640  ORF g.235640 m.235640 type:complete len:52 (-) comp18927_c0_seq11:1263-1418(-)
MMMLLLTGCFVCPPSCSVKHRSMGEAFVRFAFCKEDEVLHEAARRFPKPGA